VEVELISSTEPQQRHLSDISTITPIDNRVKQTTIMDISTLVEKVPPSLVPVLLYFPFFVGVLTIAKLLISYIRMLLSVFVLPGTNVRPLQSCIKQIIAN
jgi:hypothetical protein